MSTIIRKQPIKNLINKLSKKEKQFSFEENKLMKKPYPLLKFLSNRKYYNNNSKLILDLLTAKNKKLSKEQQNIIKSHYRPLSIMDHNHNNFKKNKKNFKIKIKKLIFAQKNLRQKEKTNVPFFNEYLKNKIVQTGDFCDKNYFSYSNKNSLNENNKINEIYNLSNQKLSCSPNKKSVNLVCHDTNCSNISVIKNRRIRIYKGKFNLTVSKKIKNNIISDEIIKDISKLKTNKCLTKFKTEIKTI